MTPNQREVARFGCVALATVCVEALAVRQFGPLRTACGSFLFGVVVAGVASHFQQVGRVAAPILSVSLLAGPLIPLSAGLHRLGWVTLDWVQNRLFPLAATLHLSAKRQLWFTA